MYICCSQRNHKRTSFLNRQLLRSGFVSPRNPRPKPCAVASEEHELQPADALPPESSEKYWPVDRCVSVTPLELEAWHCRKISWFGQRCRKFVSWRTVCRRIACWKEENESSQNSIEMLLLLRFTHCQESERCLLTSRRPPSTWPSYPSTQ